MAWPPEMAAQGDLVDGVELQSLPVSGILKSPQASGLTQGPEVASAEPNFPEGFDGIGDQNTSTMELEFPNPIRAELATAPTSSHLPPTTIEAPGSAGVSAFIPAERNGSDRVGPSGEQDTGGRELEALQPPCPQLATSLEASHFPPPKLEALQPPCPELATSLEASHLPPPKIEVSVSPGIGPRTSLSSSPDGRDANGRRVRRKSQKYLEAFPDGLVKRRSNSAKLEAGGSAAADHLNPLEISPEGQNRLSSNSEAGGEAGVGSENGKQTAKRRKLSARCFLTSWYCTVSGQVRSLQDESDPAACRFGCREIC
jgi:hypothetical protein